MWSTQESWQSVWLALQLLVSMPQLPFIWPNIMCPCQRWLRLHLQLLHLRRVLEDVLQETLLFAPLLWQFTHGNGNNKSKVKMQIFSRHQEADSSQQLVAQPDKHPAGS